MMIFDRQTLTFLTETSAILTVLFSICPVAAQNWSQTDAADAVVIHKSVSEVTVFFTATNGRKFVNDLAEQDVSVKDDNVPAARISAFRRQSDLPLRLGLLIDTSNSINYRFDFEREAARRFLKKVVRPGKDQAFILGFSDQMNLTHDYTDNPDKLARGLSTLRSEGSTAVFDAVELACWKLLRTDDQVPAARVLVLISDGDDNASKSTLEQAIEIAHRTEVTIYTIGVDNKAYTRPGDSNLKSLALQTGGKMFSPDSAQEVAQTFAKIEQEMRSRYMLAYQPADLHEDGRFHRIEVKARRLNKNIHVYAREGYYARQAFSDN